MYMCKNAKPTKNFQVTMKNIRSNHFAKATSTIYELSSLIYPANGKTLL